MDAWFRRRGYLQVSTAPAQDGIWVEALEACREVGALDAIRPLSPAEVAARCASPVFRAGAFYPDAATVQPARLALGLRERLLARGVELYESTRRCGRLRRPPDGVEARTAAGAVRAGTAIVAIGGAATARRGPLRNRLTITSSHIVLTEPVPDLLEEIGWTGGECITDCRTMLHYFRTTPDGRIAFGLGGGRIAIGGRLRGRVEVDPDGGRAGGGAAARLLPRPRGTPHHPRLGRPDRRLADPPARSSMPLPGGRAFAAAGYTGNGVGPSHMVGRILASLALDRRDEHSRLPFVDPSPQRVPPEPFHWLGGTAIRAGIMCKENASRGRQAGVQRSPRPRADRLPHRPVVVRR